MAEITMDGLVEGVAEAAADEWAGAQDMVSERMSEMDPEARALFYRGIRAAILTLLESIREPTVGMVEAADAAMFDSYARDEVMNAYTAMLSRLITDMEEK